MQDSARRGTCGLLGCFLLFHLSRGTHLLLVVTRSYVFGFGLDLRAVRCLRPCPRPIEGLMSIWVWAIQREGAMLDTMVMTGWIWTWLG